MYKGQCGRKKKAESLDFSGISAESLSCLQAGAPAWAIIRKLDLGQATITFADRDDPEIVDLVLGILLQNIARQEADT